MKDHIIIFDGVCNLCNGTVQFIIKRDKEKKFSFISFQSDAGQEMMMQYGFTGATGPSVVYLRKRVLLVKSRAVLEILKDLGAAWKLAYILMIIPPFIRDFVYNVIAKYRYRIFGKRESCQVPNSELADRIINNKFD